MNIVLLGPQGSGKSTQGDLLAEKLGISHISTGEIFRIYSDPKIKDLLARGQLIDDETTYDIVKQSIAGLRGFILDGFPRNLAQAQKEVFPVDRVINIVLTDEEAIKRLMLRKREDDTLELITKRLKIYPELAGPVFAFYRKRGFLKNLAGRGKIKGEQKPKTGSPQF